MQGVEGVRSSSGTESATQLSEGKASRLRLHPRHSSRNMHREHCSAVWLGLWRRRLGLRLGEALQAEPLVEEQLRLRLLLRLRLSLDVGVTTMMMMTMMTTGTWRTSVPASCAL